MRVTDSSERTETLLKRYGVLSRLCGSPAYIRDLVDGTDQSRSTINRAISDLEDLRLVQRGDDGIEATMAGRLARDRLEIFLADYEDILGAEGVLEPLLPAAAIDTDMIAGSEATLATDPAPYRPLEGFYDELGDATDYRAIIPMIEDPRHVRVLYEHVVIGGYPAELIVSEDVFETLRGEFPRLMAAMVEEDAFSLHVGETPSFGLCVLEHESRPKTGTTGVWLLVFAENGSVHGTLSNDEAPAVSWAEARIDACLAEATDRTSALLADTDGGVQAAVGSAKSEPMGQSLAVSLEREGFDRIDASYFREEPVADPPTAWRAGLSLTEVHTGYAVERPRTSAQGERDDGGEELSSALTGTLATGTDCVVLGPPGSGKSTTCKQVACGWYEADRGPVIYRESDRGRSFTSVDDLVATVTDADGHALVVVEDAVRPDANAVFDALERLGEREDVSVLLDSRESEWRDRSERVGGASGLDIAHVPPLKRGDCERLVEHFELTAEHPVDVSTDQLWSSVRDETAAGGDGGSNELLRLIHRLSTYADPLSSGPTALEEAVAAVYEDIVDDEVTQSVAILASVLNASGRGVDRGLLYAVADADLAGHDDTVQFDAVDDALDSLEGRILFPQQDGSYRTVHEEWSTTFLEHVLEAAGEEVATRRFGSVVGAILGLADDQRRCEQITSHVDDQLALARVIDDPEAWADDTVEAIYALGRDRATLAPLFGDGTNDSFELADACSERVVENRPVWLGGAFLAGGYYDRAEGAFERLSPEDGDNAVERLLGLARVAINRSEYDDALARCRECLSLDSIGDRPLARARAQLRLGEALEKRGEYDDAETHYEVALDEFRAGGHRGWAAKTQRMIGRVLYERDDYDRAREHYEGSLESKRDLGDRRGEANVLNDLGSLEKERGNHDRAREYCERSLEIRKLRGDRRSEADSLNSLGIIAAQQADFERATELFERSLEIRRKVGNRSGEAKCLNNLGWIAWKQGEYDQASELFERSLEINQRLDDRPNVSDNLTNLGTIAGEQGAYGRAERWFERSLELKEAMGDRQGAATARNNLGEVASRRGNFDRAETLFERSLETATDIGYRRGVGRGHTNLGLVASQRGAFDRATTLFEQSREVYDELGYPPLVAAADNNLGTVAMRSGSFDRARKYCERALEIASELDKPNELAISHHCLGEIALATEELESAGEHLERALEAAENGEDLTLLVVRLTDARFALAREDIDEARSAASGVLESAKAMDAIYWIGRTLHLLGEIEYEAGETELARERLLDAFDALQEIGAFHDALETVELLVETFDEGAHAVDEWHNRAHDLLSEAPDEVRERHETWIQNGQ